MTRALFPPHVLECAARRVEVLARLPLHLWPAFRRETADTSQATDLAAAALDTTGGDWHAAAALLFAAARDALRADEVQS